MKLFIYVTNIEDALKGDFAWSITASSRDDLDGRGVDSYQLVKEVEVELDLDREALTGKAIDSLSEQINDIKAKTTAAITLLEARQQNLLSLTHQE